MQRLSRHPGILYLVLLLVLAACSDDSISEDFINTLAQEEAENEQAAALFVSLSLEERAAVGQRVIDHAIANPSLTGEQLNEFAIQDVLSNNAQSLDTQQLGGAFDFYERMNDVELQLIVDNLYVGSVVAKAALEYRDEQRSTFAADGTDQFPPRREDTYRHLIWTTFIYTNLAAIVGEDLAELNTRWYTDGHDCIYYGNLDADCRASQIDANSTPEMVEMRGEMDLHNNAWAIEFAKQRVANLSRSEKLARSTRDLIASELEQIVRDSNQTDPNGPRIIEAYGPSDTIPSYTIDCQTVDTDLQWCFVPIGYDSLNGNGGGGGGNPNPIDPNGDEDKDGITNGEEGVGDSSPRDTDGDGTPDYQDTDSDNDGKPDSTEGTEDDDCDGTANYIDADDEDSNCITEPSPNPVELEAFVDSSDSGSFSFSNKSNESVSFTVSGGADWLSFSPTSGTLSANGSASVGVKGECKNEVKLFSVNLQISARGETDSVQIQLRCKRPEGTFEATVGSSSHSNFGGGKIEDDPPLYSAYGHVRFNTPETTELTGYGPFFKGSTREAAYAGVATWHKAQSEAAMEIFIDQWQQANPGYEIVHQWHGYSDRTTVYSGSNSYKIAYKAVGE